MSPTEKPFNAEIIFKDATEAPCIRSNNPCLPNDAGRFNNVRSGLWFDPPASDRFTFRMISPESKFTDIMGLPSGFSKPFELFIDNTSHGVYTDADVVNLAELTNSTGVREFEIRSIFPCYDTQNPLAFPIQLAFSTPTATFDMLPGPWLEVETPSDARVSLGQEASFFAAISGVPASSVRWQFRRPGGDWNDLAEGPNSVAGGLAFSARGVASPNLSLLAAGGLWRQGHSGEVRCLATGPCGTVESGAAGLLVCPADLDGNTLVDDADFIIFAAAYNILDCADPAMPVGCPADLNSDGFADDADFSVFAVAYDNLLCP